MCYWFFKHFQLILISFWKAPGGGLIKDDCFCVNSNFLSQRQTNWITLLPAQINPLLDTTTIQKFLFFFCLVSTNFHHFTFREDGSAICEVCEQIKLARIKQRRKQNQPGGHEMFHLYFIGATNLSQNTFYRIVSCVSLDQRSNFTCVIHDLSYPGLFLRRSEVIRSQARNLKTYRIRLSSGIQLESPFHYWPVCQTYIWQPAFELQFRCLLILYLAGKENIVQNESNELMIIGIESWSWENLDDFFSVTRLFISLFISRLTRPPFNLYQEERFALSKTRVPGKTWSGWHTNLMVCAGVWVRLD